MLHTHVYCSDSEIISDYGALRVQCIQKCQIFVNDS